MSSVGNITHTPSGTNNSGSVTFSHTSNSNTLYVFVGTADGAGGVVPTGVTAAGTAMTSLGTITDGAGGHFAGSHWGLAGVATSGSISIVVSWGGAAQNAGCEVTARSIIGADQTTPFGTGAQAANVATSTPSVTANSTSGQLVVGGVITFSTSVTVGDTSDGIDNNLGALGFTSAAISHATAAGSTTSLTWTEAGVQGNGWAATAVSVNDAAATSSPAWAPLSRFHPGRSPGAQRFYQSPKAYNVAATGVLAGTDGLTFGQTGTLSGAGALAGSAALTFGQSGAITGAGALSGSTALTFGQTGAITGTGALAGSAALVFGQTGTLSASGVLAGSGALTFAQTGLLAGAGALSGSSALTLGQTGVLTGSGLLSGSAALIFGATGTADVPSGAISGTTAISLGATGTLTASGTLAGIAAMLFGAFGTLDQPSTGVQLSGGFLYEFQRHHRARTKRLKDLEALADPIEREIAVLLHEPDDQSELKRLRGLVGEFTAELPDPERIQRALNRAVYQETATALRNLETEIQRAIEDEDAALMLILN